MTVSYEAEYTEKIGYRPALDGLRAFAVMAVIFLHYFDAPRFFVGSFLGVDLFFVLSGFLITRLLLEERNTKGDNDVKGFYLRRAARLLPALFLVCFVVMADAVTVNALGSAKRSLFSVVTAVGYVANWTAALHIGPTSVIDQTWSLSVEEQFYFIWPLALVLLYRYGSLRTVKIAAASVVGFAMVEMAVRSLAGVSPTVLYQSTDAHGAVMLMSGCLLATVIPVGVSLWDHWMGRLSRFALPILFIGLAFLLATLAWDNLFFYRGGYLIVAGLFALLITRALQPGVMTNVLSAAPIAWVGRISYGLYLWHIPVYFALRNKAPGLSMLQASVIALAVTFGAAIASYYLLEIPVRRAAVRYQRRRNLTPVSAVAVAQ
jgi:peptidoglycan/LPS O-acetylase OafA/YrhL